MKKSKLFAFALLILTPIIFLSGCDSPEYFTITVSSSHAEIGSVSGGNNTYIDGAAVKLIATSRNETVNPFICWVKNYSEIYSQEATINLTASNESKGNYTAIFEEESISSMTYALVTDISFGSEYTQLDYVVRYSTQNNTVESQTLAEGSKANPSEKITSNVLRLVNGVTPIDYTFSATITITDITGTSRSTLNLSGMLLSDVNFDERGIATLSQQNITITLSKLTKASIM